jgi:nuclear GTP-binding protein
MMLLQDEEREADVDKPQQNEPRNADVMQDETMSVTTTDCSDTKLSSTTRQHEKLYTAEGILDPRKRRAEKKRRKANRLGRTNDMDADYDFKVDYNMRDAPSDDGDNTDGEITSDGKKESMVSVE